MAKRKPASNGQSPKPQAAGGGASRSFNSQAANTSHPQKTANAAKHPTLPGTPRPPQNAPNGTRSQGPGNGAPKSQGANRQPSNFAARVEVTSGPRAMNEGPKRNGNGQNNHPQKAQGHGPQPTSNGSSKQQAPKPPKHSQPLVGGHSLAPNPSLYSPTPPRLPHPVNVQGTSITGNKAFRNPSPTSKQGGHAHPHVQKTQNHVQTPPKASQTNQSGKNTNSIFPKVQVAKTPQTSRGGASSATKGPQAGNSSQQQHKAPGSHSQETSKQGHKKPTTNDNRQQPPTASGLPNFFSFFSGCPQNTPQKSQQHKAATHSHPVQEVSNKGPNLKDISPKLPMNDRRRGQTLTESVLSTPKGSPPILTAGYPRNPSHKSQHTASTDLHPPQEVHLSIKGNKDGPPKPPTNDKRKGQPPESVLPKVYFSTESKDNRKRSSNFVVPPELTRNSLSSTVGSGTSKKPNVKQGTAGVPQAAAAPLGWGQMLSSWFYPSAPSIDKGPQTTSQPTSSLRKVALSGTMDRSQVPSKPNKSTTASATATHRKKVTFPVQSGSSRVQILSQQLRKRAALKKELLRQRGPTLKWREGETPGTVSAYSTLTAPPVPSPPENELQNKVALRTISKNPDLFKVVSPINAEAFKENLKDHPNQPFVESVVSGLKNGFWPWADTRDLPTTYDGSGQRSRTTSKDPDRANFIKQQSKDEVDLGRYSKAFGNKLHPGMHASPISAVPKSTPGKYRLVNDQSRGPHSLNSTIGKSQVKVKLDTVHDLGNKLLAVRKKLPKRKLVLWKSDVKSAYRQLPVHPLWQIKQAVPVDGQYHIDRCNSFGNRGGGWNWDRFISLVNWIGIEKKGVSDLLGYVDDNFGWEFAGKKEYYEPYKKKMPTKQVRLLRLWDDLGIPHDEEKQLSGSSLRILGYDVDANKMTVNVPDEKKEKVVRLLRSHAQEGKPYTVNDLQTAAGSVNSTLSLYPNIRPGLNVLFDEMAKQAPGTTKLKVTKDVARTLSGLANFLEDAPPVPIREQKKRVRARDL